jgi:hypothetical protein
MVLQQVFAYSFPTDPKIFPLFENRNLADPGEPGYNACAKVQPLIRHGNTVFQQHISDQQLSIGESLVYSKNDTQLLRYLHNKHHHRWGIKLWM